MEKENPTYYAILPSSVRYCKELSPFERLLYAEITCLTNYKGYCWAENNYFCKLYGKSMSTISRSVSKLSSLGFIDVKIIRNGNKQVESRLIKIKEIPGIKDINTYTQKRLGGIVKNDKENNNNNNKKNKDVLFEKFWDAYNFKKSRKLCYTKFMALSYKICEKCVVAAKEYSASITDIKFKKHPSTWLNQGCWDDEITQRSTNDGKIKGGKWDGMVF